MEIQVNEKKGFLIIALFSLFLNGYLKGAGLVNLSLICSLVVYIIFGLIGLHVGANLLGRRQSFWQIVTIFGLLGISMFGKGTVAFTLLLLAGIFILYIRDEDVMQIYTVALTLDVTVCVVLSVVGITPLFSNEGLITFGFVNQNGIAFYFAIATIMWIRKAQSVLSFSIATLVVIIESIIMYYYWSCFTGLWMLVGFWVLLLLFKINMWKYLKYLLVAAPLILFLFVLIIGYLYSELNSLDGLNQTLNGRPFIWNQYITRAGFKVFGSSADVNEAEFGPIDGSYLATPLEYGAIWTVFLVFALIGINVFLGKTKQWDILALAIVMEISGASENKLSLIYGTPIMVFAIKHLCTKYRMNKKAVEYDS